MQSRKNKIIEIEPSILRNINTVIKLTDLKKEEKTSLIKIRLGQSNYRQELIKYWEKSSVVKLEVHELLIASHIKPYFECNEEEKYDLFNGLLLSPNYDKLFDTFLISFDDNGKLLISSKLNKSDLKKLGISKNDALNSEKLSPNHQNYLKYHRDRFNEREMNNKMLLQQLNLKLQ